MTDKITKTIQTEIEKIETKIASLENELKTARTDLNHKKEILTLAVNGGNRGGTQ